MSSAMLAGATLWTLDKPLVRIVRALGISADP
jgi:hypothetical protein